MGGLKNVSTEYSFINLHINTVGVTKAGIVTMIIVCTYHLKMYYLQRQFLLYNNIQVTCPDCLLDTRRKMWKMSKQIALYGKWQQSYRNPDGKKERTR